MLVIECVPNLSEGRRADRLRDWADDLASVPGLALLDWSGDPSHNRSVFTMAGDKAAVREGALRLAAHAVEEIDLTAQRGVHPRLGAIDVVPFVPLRDTPLRECVVLAREVGQALADRFSLPVYLYEAAAFRADRRRLEDIRRGGFEGLPVKLMTTGWEPDFGPRDCHPTAGAAVVGARPILIAYNVNLATDRTDLARRIAATVRERGGGLPGVKALGLWLEQRRIAQVSMNLVDFARTTPKMAFDAVAALAAKEGVAVLESELIGLIPEAALADTSASELKLVDFAPERLIERQLERFGL